MKKNKLIIYFLFLSIFSVASSCTDNYLDYNRDKSGATHDEMERDGYSVNAAFRGLQSNVISVDVNNCQFVDCLLGGSFGGYFADSNDGFNGKNFATYNPEDHWSQVAFNTIIKNVFVQHDKIKVVTENPILLAVADIIKVLSISRVTDIYGPIPYSKIGEGGKLEAPYDSQEEVYMKMFEQLDNAIAVLSEPENRTKDFSAKADRVYGGNVEKWTKLANSIKLRLAIRIAYANENLAREKAEEAANHEIGTMTAIEDNAFLSLESKNPFRVVMYEYNKGDSRISADISSYMNGYKDPRREKFFVPSKFQEPGIPNGFFGLRSGILIPSSEEIKNYANMNVKEDDKILWMNAAEVAFLKAEGALRSWNMGPGSSAESFYKMGVQLSFEQWGASGAENYLNDDTSMPELYVDPLGDFSSDATISQLSIKWDTTADEEIKLERIITQKWIANFPLGIEAWSEFRRTGYPKLMNAVVNNSAGKVNDDRMARRLSYPQKEYTENAENLANAISQLLKGEDTMGTDVWWAKKR